MTIARRLIATAIAAVALGASALPALSAEAYATSHLNVRSGPGTGYRAVDVLARGQVVDVQYCKGSWCYVTKPGPDGWVSANYLASVNYTPPKPRPPVVVKPQPGFSFEFNFGNQPKPRPPHPGPGWPGPGPGYPPPPPPPQPPVSGGPVLNPDGSPVWPAPGGGNGQVCWYGPYGYVCQPA